MSFENPQAELLGMCLADPKALEKAMARGVKLDTFLDADHRDIFEAVLAAEKSGRPTKARFIAAALPRLRDQILALREGAHVSLNPEYFIDETLAQVWQQDATHKLNDLLRQIRMRRPFADVSPIKAAISQAMDLLLGGIDGATSGAKTVAAVLGTELEKMELEIIAHREGKVAGIPTGIAALDKITSGGLKRGSVNVFAARTGMGKTTLALNLAHHAACQGFAVCYFTVEMPAGQLARKLLSLISTIKGRKIMTGELSENEMDKMQAAVRELHARPIWIDDSFRASYEMFELSCRKLKRAGNLDVLVVDYIQQLTLEGRHQIKVQVVSEVSHRLKQLAIELDVAVISLAQFNRDAEKDGGEPAIWQVKDSGAIEQDADLGVCLFRDEKDRYWLKVDKNRWGKDRMKFLIDADLSVNIFRDANINLPEDF